MPSPMVDAYPAQTRDTAAERRWRVTRRHPSADLVAAAAGMFEARLTDDRLPVNWRGGRQAMQADRRFELTVGPGLLALRVFDPLAAERRDNPYLSPAPVYPDYWGRPNIDPRELLDCEAQALNHEYFSARYWRERVERLEAGIEPWGYVGRSVTEWSRKSRTRMVRAIAELDLASFLEIGAPQMLTFTYPGDWLAVAPNGKAVKQHMRIFALRYRRRWGVPLRGLWKLEFQRRGAPHIHVLTVPPRVAVAEFRDWCRQTWAGVVAHPDPEQRARHSRAGVSLDVAEGLRAKDPRRCAVYFLKHSSKTIDDKEYQHIVPAAWREPGQGPGRFWGYWGLTKSGVAVDIDLDDFFAVKRCVRRWGAANGRRVMAQNRLVGGFAVVNSGPSFASAIARWLDMRKAGSSLTARQTRLARLLLDRSRT